MCFSSRAVTKNVFSLYGGKHNIPENSIHTNARDFYASKEWPWPRLAYVKLWRRFVQQVLSYGSKCAYIVSQGQAKK